MFEQNYVYINKCAYPQMNYKLIGIIRNASSLSMYTALTLFFLVPCCLLVRMTCTNFKLNYPHCLCSSTYVLRVHTVTHHFFAQSITTPSLNLANQLSGNELQNGTGATWFEALKTLGKILDGFSLDNKDTTQHMSPQLTGQ